MQRSHRRFCIGIRRRGSMLAVSRATNRKTTRRGPIKRNINFRRTRPLYFKAADFERAWFRYSLCISSIKNSNYAPSSISLKMSGPTESFLSRNRISPGSNSFLEIFRNETLKGYRQCYSARDQGVELLLPSFCNNFRYCELLFNVYTRIYIKIYIYRERDIQSSPVGLVCSTILCILRIREKTLLWWWPLPWGSSFAKKTHKRKEAWRIRGKDESKRYGTFLDGQRNKKKNNDEGKGRNTKSQFY